MYIHIQESVAVVEKATEMFIEELTKQVALECQSRKKKIIKMEDILQAINNNPTKYEFLFKAFGPIDL